MVLFSVSGMRAYGPRGEPIIQGFCWEKTNTRAGGLAYYFHVFESNGASCIYEAHPEEQVPFFI